MSKKCKAISPVPGGVGPMTITMLLKNTVDSAKKAGKPTLKAKSKAKAKPKAKSKAKAKAKK